MPNIINEYIDDRFTQPPLLSAEPQVRARARQLLSTIDNELYSHVVVLEQKLKSADSSRAHIRDRLIEFSGQFGKHTYLLGKEIAMPDIAMAPLLWRLDHYGIELPKSIAPLKAYAQQLFNRRGFIESLTPTEKMMRRE